jgi:hypothetical protein
MAKVEKPGLSLDLCAIVGLRLQRKPRSLEATLLALLVVARYPQHQGDTQRICVDHPPASVCHR